MQSRNQRPASHAPGRGGDGSEVAGEARTTTANRKMIDPATRAAIDLLFGGRLSTGEADLGTFEKECAGRVQRAEIEMRARIDASDRRTRDLLEALERVAANHPTDQPKSRGTGGGGGVPAGRQLDRRLHAVESDLARAEAAAQQAVGEELARVASSTRRLRDAWQDEIASIEASLAARTGLGGIFLELGKRVAANAGARERV